MYGRHTSMQRCSTWLAPADGEVHTKTLRKEHYTPLRRKGFGEWTGEDSRKLFLLGQRQETEPSTWTAIAHVDPPPRTPIYNLLILFLAVRRWENTFLFLYRGMPPTPWKWSEANSLSNSWRVLQCLLSFQVRLRMTESLLPLHGIINCC